jgi:hypothetical protein
MTILEYPAKAALGDYARAAVGLVFTAGPAIGIAHATGHWTFAHWILVPLAVLFAAFAWRTWRRQATQVAWDETGLSLSGAAQVSLRWDQVRSLKLAFYATSRDRTGGWMQLTIGSDTANVKADSGAVNFPDLAARAVAAAIAANIPIDAASRANFQALGIRIPEVGA